MGFKSNDIHSNAPTSSHTREFHGPHVETTYGDVDCGANVYMYDSSSWWFVLLLPYVFNKKKNYTKTRSFLRLYRVRCSFSLFCVYFNFFSLRIFSIRDILLKKSLKTSFCSFSFSFLLLFAVHSILYTLCRSIIKLY